MINPDDLDQIFRGIHLLMEGRDNDLKVVIPCMVDKYRAITILEQDRKLLLRFYFRLSELELRIKNTQVQSFLNGLKEMVQGTGSNWSVVLASLAMDVKPEETSAELKRIRKIAPWQKNVTDNRQLYQFYENDFWKYYDIMQLNRQHCGGLIVFHQTKDENLQRLYEESLERNSRFTNYQRKKYSMEHLTQRAKTLKDSQNQTIQTPYSHKNITMFGSPQKRNHSPSKEERVIDLFELRQSRIRNFSSHTHTDTRRNNIKENSSPHHLPDIKLVQEDQLIRPIQIGVESKQYFSPQKKRPQIQIAPGSNSGMYQGILPQYKTNCRAFQTIRNMIRK